MTDLPTLPRPLTLSVPLARVSRLAARLLTSLFRSRRANALDPGHTSDHLLKDIGVSRAPAEPPRITSLDIR